MPTNFRITHPPIMRVVPLRKTNITSWLRHHFTPIWVTLGYDTPIRIGYVSLPPNPVITTSTLRTVPEVYLCNTTYFFQFDLPFAVAGLCNESSLTAPVTIAIALPLEVVGWADEVPDRNVRSVADH
ncbi:hypothetical protein D8B26_007621 [Coccidioides posadasii str. Silveira]|uniref:uncharacterized protein n=1 Tax=Coccidioides posadasii (strain RMSCC 757 / Silveira) TaxID=443226 RepID=UPI001BED66EE|nr:hypothetical protein D8B26_007621 [Coccidioides posadasii str. Silveira]